MTPATGPYCDSEVESVDIGQLLQFARRTGAFGKSSEWAADELAGESQGMKSAGRRLTVEIHPIAEVSRSKHAVQDRACSGMRFRPSSGICSFKMCFSQRMSKSKDPAREDLAGRRNAKGENRLPPAAAVVVAGLTYALLPGTLLFVPRFGIPALEIALLVALIATNPRRMTRETRWSRIASAVLASVVIATNLVALGLLVEALTRPATPGGPLLVAAMQVWITNVIGFALLYWELDRGGPVARRTTPRDNIQPADWRFSHDENADTVVEVAATASERSGWIPTFIDYMYLSLTNSSAFSPTDTMPLSTRAKVLMGVQSTAALLTSLLVIARAVGSFGS